MLNVVNIMLYVVYIATMLLYMYVYIVLYKEMTTSGLGVF